MRNRVVCVLCPNEWSVEYLTGDINHLYFLLSVARVQPTVLFDLEIIMQVLEIFIQGKPSFIDVGREFTFKHG